MGAVTPEPEHLALRITDPETARVVAIHHAADRRIVGAGCLVDEKRVLTCRHVVQAALDRLARAGKDRLVVSLPGVTRQPSVFAHVVAVGECDGPENDLALLEIRTERVLDVLPVEFATPLRHAGKQYSVLGFPGGDPQGRNVVGTLHAADTKGLVQMDRGGALSVLGGFSGAPVWSSTLGAFVGIVVREQAGSGISWCIPSRRLSLFAPDLLVKFRVPLADRPEIHDWGEDEPNRQLFGRASSRGDRRLEVVVKKNADKDREDDFKAIATYHAGKSSRGGYVTFITHPSYTSEDEDAYELFARIDPATGTAETEFYPESPFVVAAVGDAGDTALTLDLSTLPNNPRGFD